jgi:hypothetical protein
VSDEYDVGQVLVIDDMKHILGMGAQIDFAIEEMPALANARERRRIDLVACFP